MISSVRTAKTIVYGESDHLLTISTPVLLPDPDLFRGSDRPTLVHSPDGRHIFYGFRGWFYRAAERGGQSPGECFRYRHRSHDGDRVVGRVFGPQIDPHRDPDPRHRARHDGGRDPCRWVRQWPAGL